ncbi:MAG: hypothetical protein ABSG53_07255, partial [Thermoguttaceae bacterium]
NQEAILAAFQEERWPWRIDDPLRRRGDLDSKVRLNNTVKALNRHRLAMVIWFSCDGSGRGVVWQLLPNW